MRCIAGAMWEDYAKSTGVGAALAERAPTKGTTGDGGISGQLEGEPLHGLGFELLVVLVEGPVSC